MKYLRGLVEGSTGRTQLMLSYAQLCNKPAVVSPESRRGARDCARVQASSGRGD